MISRFALATLAANTGLSKTAYKQSGNVTSMPKIGLPVTSRDVDPAELADDLVALDLELQTIVGTGAGASRLSQRDLHSRALLCSIATRRPEES